MSESENQNLTPQPKHTKSNKSTTIPQFHLSPTTSTREFPLTKINTLFDEKIEVSDLQNLKNSLTEKSQILSKLKNEFMRSQSAMKNNLEALYDIIIERKSAEESERIKRN